VNGAPIYNRLPGIQSMGRGCRSSASPSRPSWSTTAAAPRPAASRHEGRGLTRCCSVFTDLGFIIAVATVLDGQLSGSDAEGDSLTWNLTGPPPHGAPLLDTKIGSFSYTRQDPFQLMANDGNGFSAGSAADVIVDAEPGRREVVDPHVLAAPKQRRMGQDLLSQPNLEVVGIATHHHLVTDERRRHRVCAGPLTRMVLHASTVVSNGCDS